MQTLSKPDISPGVRLRRDGRSIRLKWHRLRRTKGDVDFTMHRLREGLAAGASMEIDLRRHAESGFVCLHDAVLESETNGSGPIFDATVADLRSLRMRSPRGGLSDEPLLLLEDLVAAIAAGHHPDAIVQFDLKEWQADLDDATVAAFMRLVRPVAKSIVLSGDDWSAVKLLGAQIEGLRLGYDPSDLPEAQHLETRDDFAGFARFTLNTAPQAVIIYLEYHLVLRSLAAGFDIVAALQEAGREIDAWTFDLKSPRSTGELAALIASGIDQLSSNDCVAIEAAAAGL